MTLFGANHARSIGKTDGDSQAGCTQAKRSEMLGWAGKLQRFGSNWENWGNLWEQTIWILTLRWTWTDSIPQIYPGSWPFCGLVQVDKQSNRKSLESKSSRNRVAGALKNLFFASDSWLGHWRNSEHSNFVGAQWGPISPISPNWNRSIQQDFQHVYRNFVFALGNERASKASNGGDWSNNDWGDIWTRK